jgi:hypothetical protein
VARKRLLSITLGQRLLQSKLDVLSGTGGRRPSVALAILTGGAPEPRPVGEIPRLEPLPFPSLRQPEPEPEARPEVETPVARRQVTRHTVYLSDRHLRDLDAIVAARQPAPGKRLTRSAVLRRAIEHLHAETFPAPHAPAQEHPEHA